MKKIYLAVAMLVLGYFIGWFFNQDGATVLKVHNWNSTMGHLSVESSGWIFFEDESRTIKDDTTGTRAKIVYNDLVDKNNLFYMESLQFETVVNSPILRKIPITENSIDKIVGQDDVYKIIITPEKAIIEDKGGKMYLDKHFFRF